MAPQTWQVRGQPAPAGYGAPQLSQWESFTERFSGSATRGL
ncbi:hypothetical protein [Streptomyces sp. NP-1717]|nr:hypothetical protein [Streptomyces sp. NP-1717]